MAYKLRWNIETFFAWWKQYLKVYHLISRSKQGLMVQMLAGMTTYLLMAPQRAEVMCVSAAVDEYQRDQGRNPPAR